MTRVLIAGAGPVGMTCAALLHSAGVDVTVLEREPEPNPAARAVVTHPRTLEVLQLIRLRDGRRLTDRLIAEGATSEQIHFGSLPRQLNFHGLDSPYPHVLLLSQVHIENALAEHLAEIGVPIQRGVAVTGVTDTGTEVVVTTSTGEFSGDYLIGADGAHSTVRKALDIAFPGTKSTMLGFVADIELATPVATEHRWDHERGWLSIIRLSEQLYRVFGAEPGDVGLSEDEIRLRRAQPLTGERLQQKLIRAGGEDLRISRVVWSSQSGDSTRYAAEYRRGRVFLVGDAAHVHLAAGGQGLNVGVQDAVNLVWKLVGEIRGDLDDCYLEGARSYGAERAPIGARLGDNTLAQSALMTTFTPAGAALRDVVSTMLADQDATSDMVGWVSGVGISYAPGDHPLIGRRVADPEVLRALRVDRFLLWDNTDTLVVPPELDRVRAHGQDFAAALVRPDGYVAAVWNDARTANDALDSWPPATEGVCDTRWMTFTHRLRVRYSECDQQGIVFNGHYLFYYDVAVAELLRHHGWTISDIVAEGWDLVVAETTLRYRASARYDDEIDISVPVTHIGTTSLIIEPQFRVGDRLIVDGSVRHVCVDPQTLGKKAVPEGARAKLLTDQGRESGSTQG